MMGWIFAGMVWAAVLFGLLQGRLGEVSAAAMSGAADAVSLSLELLGMLCLWSGMMAVAEKSGLARALCGALAPLLRRLFPGLRKESPALSAIGMNLAANLMGLGNAATPLGLAAMRELDRENGHSHTASDAMVVFVVLNTASLQLLPATTAALRMQEGSAAPLEILPAVWLSSVLSVSAGLLTAFALRRRGKGAR